jgi:hypothetical protein
VPDDQFEHEYSFTYIFWRVVEYIFDVIEQMIDFVYDFIG